MVVVVLVGHVGRHVVVGMVMGMDNYWRRGGGGGGERGRREFGRGERGASGYL